MFLTALIITDSSNLGCQYQPRLGGENNINTDSFSVFVFQLVDVRDFVPEHLEANDSSWLSDFSDLLEWIYFAQRQSIVLLVVFRSLNHTDETITLRNHVHAPARKMDRDQASLFRIGCLEDVVIWNGLNASSS